MSFVALVGYLLFLLLAFGLRTALHFRHTGRTGFVGLSGAVGSLEWGAGVLFGAAILGGLLAPLMQMLGVLRPWYRGSAVIDGGGIAFFVVGLAGTCWAQWSMGDSWRIGVDPAERTELVRTGPFAWMRNPIFTWMAFASAGLVLLAPNVLSATSLVLLVVALQIQVRVVEEPYLLQAHGQTYRDYAAVTGRFLPGIGRLCGC